MERDLNEVVEDCLGCFQRKENQDPPEYGGDRETKSSKEVTMLGDDSDRTDYEGHISVDENPEGESEKMTDIPNGFVRNDDEDIFAEAKSDNRDNQADISNNQAIPRTILRKKIRAKNSGFSKGDKVYWRSIKEDKAPSKWNGQGMVDCQDGKVVFVMNGNVMFRISANRLLKARKKFGRVVTVGAGSPIPATVRLESPVLATVDCGCLHSTLEEQLGWGQAIRHRLQSCNHPRLWRWREEK